MRTEIHKIYIYCILQPPHQLKLVNQSLLTQILCTGISCIMSDQVYATKYRH